MLFAINLLAICTIVLILITVSYLVFNLNVCGTSKISMHRNSNNNSNNESNSHKNNDGDLKVVEAMTNAVDKYQITVYNILDAMTVADVGKQAADTTSAKRSLSMAKSHYMQNYPLIVIDNGGTTGQFDFGKVKNFTGDFTMHFYLKLKKGTANTTVTGYNFLEIYDKPSSQNNSGVETGFVDANAIKYTVSKTTNDIDTISVDADSVIFNNTESLNDKWISFKIVYDKDSKKLITETSVSLTSGLNNNTQSLSNVASLHGFKFASILTATNTDFINLEITGLQIWNKKFL